MKQTEEAFHNELKQESTNNKLFMDFATPDLPDEIDVDETEIEDDEWPIENIDNYTFQFLKVPEIANRSRNLKRLSDKQILKMELEINDMVYENLDKLDITYHLEGNVEYLLFDYSNIELETPQSLYGIIIKSEKNKLRYFTLEIDKKLCLCEVEYNAHSLMGFNHSLLEFHEKLSKQEFIDIALNRITGA